MIKVIEVSVLVSEICIVVVNGCCCVMEFLIFLVFGGVAGIVIDQIVFEEVKVDFKWFCCVYDEIFNYMVEVVVVFDCFKCMSFYNIVFIKLFKLDDVWLMECLGYVQMLDCMWEKCLLFEQVDYFVWKVDELVCYDDSLNDESLDEFWLFLDGCILCVVCQCYLFGGVMLIFEDKIDEFVFKVCYNMFINVQCVMLDKLYEVVVVFGVDGCFQLNNNVFEEFWGF